MVGLRLGSEKNPTSPTPIPPGRTGPAALMAFTLPPTEPPAPEPSPGLSEAGLEEPATAGSGFGKRAAAGRWFLTANLLCVVQVVNVLATGSAMTVWVISFAPASCTVSLRRVRP